MTNTDPIQGVPRALDLYAVPDRLAQPPGKCFAVDPLGSLHWFFRIGLPAAAAAAAA